MLKSKALALTVSKTAFAFLPILLAPLCLGTSIVLLDFYKLQLGLSIVAAIGSLGLGSYIYALAADYNWSHADRLDLTYSILLFKAASTFLFSVGIIFSIAFYWYTDSMLYYKYVLLIPFSYFFVEQQIRLAKQHYLFAFISFVMPSMIFVVILVFTYLLGENYFNKVCLITLGFADLAILKVTNFWDFKKTFGLRWLRLKRHLQKSKVTTQICNGIIAYICPPIVTLIIISWLESLQFTSQIIAAYYLYARAIDSFISLLITYFAAGHIQEIMNRNKIRFAPIQVALYISLLCIFYFSINYVVNYLAHYMNFLMAGLEVGIGLVKFFLAIFTLLAIKKYPKIIGAKELLIVLIVYLLSLLFTPVNIYYFQISILITFLTILLALVLMMRSIKSSALLWLR